MQPVHPEVFGGIHADQVARAVIARQTPMVNRFLAIWRDYFNSSGLQAGLPLSPVLVFCKFSKALPSGPTTMTTIRGTLKIESSKSGPSRVLKATSASLGDDDLGIDCPVQNSRYINNTEATRKIALGLAGPPQFIVSWP
ncbi:hypothetical protein B0H13DRAFT_1881897 [Mycena leptocephala]|nr:hypothetical protein B0H13DRAFT_1881897 [Mycena leptocephala]